MFLLVARVFRYYGLEYFPFLRRLIKNIGVLPIHNQYYQPQFIYKNNFDFDQERNFIFEINIENQFKRLEQLSYREELSADYFNRLNFNLNNGSFEHGDAELYYLILRNLKPSKIIEIGSGYSTKIASIALLENHKQGASTAFTAIEPYEHDWIEHLPGISVLRSKVEDVDIEFFKTLTRGDILFIDSSHIIRPENDVLYIYLKILPVLSSGVVIHVHDIFTPRHYPLKWMKNEFRLWNEQYLLETILTYGSHFEILYSLNHLFKSDFTRLKSTLPYIIPKVNPASFWMVKQ